jgi:tetratricopeptide (TPR) repeat protein
MATLAKIVSYPQDKVRPELNQPEPQQPQTDSGQTEDFFGKLAGSSELQAQVQLRQKECLAEIALLRAEKKWEEIVDMFYPLEVKEPDIVDMGIDILIRKELAFALGQLKRFDLAIQEFENCLKVDPDNFHCHAGLGFTLYNSLFAAKNKKILLPYKVKKEHIRKAHEHFKRAQELQPERVTNFYREGMLFKNIQDKPDKALPLFGKAVSNWEKYDEEKKKIRHQEYKNYVKSLYNLATCQLKLGQKTKALKNIQKCIHEDEGKEYVKPEHKYFALGKIQFQLKNFQEAKDALKFAATFISPAEGDYVLELLARVMLRQGEKNRALDSIQKIPEKRRRPFVRWTEADILVSLGNMEKAKSILLRSADKDRRSRHKSFIRLSKIAFLENDYKQTVLYADKGNQFHIETYSTPDADSLFWMAAGYLRLNDLTKAREKIEELSSFKPGYVLLPKLKAALDKKSEQ